MLCEAFGCVPSVAIEEMRRLPAEYIELVLEANAIRHAKHRYDAVKNEADMPKDDKTIDLVRELTFELAAEAIAKKRNG